MRIIQTNGLTQEQTQGIRALERICHEAEALENPLFLSNENNFDREIPVFFLALEGETLTGFLTFFIPTKEEAEISAIVHPLYRRRGVFTALDAAARRVIEASGIGRILYCVETKSVSAAQVLKRRGISHIARSEYRMQRDAGLRACNAQTAACGAAFTAKRVTPENIAAYLQISARAFDGEDGCAYADAIMTSDTRMGYVFCRDDEPIGAFVIGLEQQGKPFIYGVAIAEGERGKGYGRLLMEQACGLAAAHGDVLRLDVDSDNPVAYRLYRNMGFETTFQVDYYKR